MSDEPRELWPPCMWCDSSYHSAEYCQHKPDSVDDARERAWRLEEIWANVLAEVARQDAASENAPGYRRKQYDLHVWYAAHNIREALRINTEGARDA